MFLPNFAAARGKDTESATTTLHMSRQPVGAAANMGEHSLDSCRRPTSMNDSCDLKKKEGSANMNLDCANEE